MRVTRISQGGQIQVPAEVRRRWGTSNVVIEDLGDEISVRPVPDDPISLALRPLKGGRTSEEWMRISREEEAAAEERKWGDSSRRVGTYWRAEGRAGEG
jgi:bifunctional DNA-binding transcriptional regulator/antitoxin component of YhaV-PrlF toxin-antitoxin module